MAEPIWLPRRLEQQEGRLPRKVRVSVPGGVQTTIARTTAADYATAHSFMREIGADGIGLVLGTPMANGRVPWGIDCDSCRNCETGQIDFWARDIIRCVGSRTEVSQSHKGIKIFATLAAADLPIIEEAIFHSKRSARGASRSCRKWAHRSDTEHGPQIDLSISKRFYDYTGLHLSDTPVELRQVELATILDLINRIGPEFEADDPSRLNPPQPPVGLAPSQSLSPINDNAAARIPLDTTTLEPEIQRRVEDAMAANAELRKRVSGDFSGLSDSSGSGRKMALGGAAKRASLSEEDAFELMRRHPMTAASAEKEGARGLQKVWDNAYERNAIEPQEAFGHVKPLPAATKFIAPMDPLADLNHAQRRLARRMIKRSRQDLANMPTLRWLYQGLFQASGIVFIAGPPKSLKSFIVLLIAVCAAAGAPFAGVEPSFGPVRVALWIGEGASGLHARLAAIEDYYGLQVGDRLSVLTGPFVADEVIELLTPGPPAILIIDTWARAVAAAGLDENSTRDMGLAIAAIDRIQDALQCLIMPVHHTGKDSGKGMRGSTALLGAADGVYIVSKLAPGVAALVNTEMKEAETARPLVFELKKIGESAAAVLSESMTPIIPGGTPPVPEGEVEIVIMEILETLMPSDKLPLPPRTPSAPSPSNILWSGLISNAIRVDDAREAFVLRRPGDRRHIKVQCFTRGLKRLQRKGLVFLTGEWVQLRNHAQDLGGSNE